MIILPRGDSRVTTREFYKALLEIKPELQKLNSSVKRLEGWAFADNGKKCVDTRLKKIESFVVTSKTNNRIVTALIKAAWTLLGIITGLAANSSIDLF